MFPPFLEDLNQLGLWDLGQPLNQALLAYWKLIKSFPAKLPPGLIGLERIWTGFGLGTTTGVPRPAILFNVPVSDAVLALFPRWVREANPLILGGIRMKTIAPGRPSVSRELRPGARIEFVHRNAQGEQIRPSGHGTAGAILKDSDDPATTWLLSANHVMGMNLRGVSRVVSLEGGPELSRDIRVVKVNGAGNLVDVAVAKLPHQIVPAAVSAGVALTTPDFSTEAEGALVRKVGMEGPAGTVKIRADRIEIGYSDCCGIQTAEFNNQWLIADGEEAFSAAGDSGSLVATVSGDEVRGFGMLIANQEPLPSTSSYPLPDARFSVVTPMSAIVHSLSEIGIRATLP